MHNSFSHHACKGLHQISDTLWQDSCDHRDYARKFSRNGLISPDLIMIVLEHPALFYQAANSLVITFINIEFEGHSRNRSIP